MKRLVLILAICLSACATNLAPNQAALNATYASYASLDQAILASDAAVKAGSLKGADAKRTLQALTTAKAGLDTALAVMNATTAASGVSK